MFREAGYYTAGFGKIYHGNVENQDLANWDVFTPKPHGATPPDASIPINGLDEITRGGPGGGDWGIVDAPDAEFADHIIASLVEDFIRQREPATRARFSWHSACVPRIHRGTSRRTISRASQEAIPITSCCPQ